MLPYANNGGYGGGSYGRRKGLFNSQNTTVSALAVVAIVALGFSVFTHFRASSANAQNSALRNELESVRSELHSIKSQFSSRNAELEQLQLTYGHTQRRITELSNQLQRKESDLISKEQALQQHVKERSVMEQHRSGREAELTKMVEDLRQELIRSDGVIEALDTKVAQMEGTHSTREKDWHILANKWIKYEQDLHDQYRKCTDEVAKLRNLTVTANDTEPIPEAEPKLRPETDFGQIKAEVPQHKPHHFEPLAPPTPVELPMPEPKIRDSVIQMTGGKLGLEPGQAAPADHPASASSTGASQAPEPTHVHHGDTYHHDFNHDNHDDHWAHLHNYDHYHGHYDHYDPLDEWWIQDGHGDWNADSHNNDHNNNHDAHANEQHHFQGHEQQHHEQHHQQHHEQHHEQHHFQQDNHEQHRYHYQEHGSPQDWNNHHHQQLPAMQGMDQHAHAQHAPSPQQQQHYHDHYQQQQHHHHQQHHPQQHHPQQHQQQHGEHPRGDLAYKMGW